MLPEKVYLIADTALLLNLSGDVVHSMDNRRVGPIEGKTDGLQGLVRVLATEIHAKISRIDHAFFARIRLQRFNRDLEVLTDNLLHSFYADGLAAVADRFQDLMCQLEIDRLVQE